MAKNVSLETICGGVLNEKFQKSLEKVLENLQNPNTPYKPVRGITISIAFAQNEKRDDVKCTIQVKEKLVPMEAVSTAFAVGRDLATGKVVAEEYGKQIPGQMSIADYEGEKVDTTTGEIIDLRSRKVAK